MLANGLSGLLTFENLQSIEDGVKLYDNILLTISHKDAKAEYEFIQAKQNIEEKILEQKLHQRTKVLNSGDSKMQWRTFQGVTSFEKIFLMNLIEKNNIWLKSLKGNLKFKRTRRGNTSSRWK